MPTGPLTFTELLDTLGHQPDDHLALCTQTPGGPFTSRVVTTTTATHWNVPNDRDTWFSVNPITGPARDHAGRGTTKDVTRLAALYADLDVKTGGLDSFDTARDVIDALSDMLGSRPVATTLSGNGLQPYWALDDTTSGPDATALLRRFGRLVRHVADIHGGHVDSVFDLARVLRVPGSANHKNPTDTKPVITLPDTGHPLTVTEIDEALNAYGATEQPEDREEHGQVLATPASWAYADRTCIYARTMIDSWASENPTARHPWLLAQATRIAAAHRRGCLTQADYTTAVHTLAARFRALLATGERRDESPGEIIDALAWGRTAISTKTDTAVARELGDHKHTDALLDLVPHQPPTPPAPVAGHDTPTPAPPAPAATTATPWTPTVIQGGQTTQHGGNGHDTDGATALAPHPAPSTLERSEDGHAHQLISAYGDLIRYCHERGRWLVWNSTRWTWQPPGGGEVREYAKTVARAFDQSDNGALAHKKKCLSSAGISGCLKQAETDPRVIVSISDLDADPWTLNTPAGTVDLRTGQLHAPDPAALCTKTTLVGPATTPDPAWAQFLADTFGDDHDTRDYVQRLVGLTLIGQVREQLLAFLHGLGANGKSTLAETLMHALGVGETGYAIAAAAEMLMIRKHTEHPAELAQLAGARMVVCSELDDGQRFAEARIKQLTGRDSINARFLYGQPFTFAPSHTIWLLGNHRPQARTGGMAFWRRVKLIEFPNVVPPERRDPALGDKLNAAAGTVLAWAIRGALDYQNGGIREPGSVTEAVASYAADQDTVGRFVTEACHRAGSDLIRVTASELRDSYEAWCRDVGEEPASAKRLGQELRDRFDVGEHRSNGRRYYTRICLLSIDDETPDGPPEGSAGSGVDLIGDGR